MALGLYGFVLWGCSRAVVVAPPVTPEDRSIQTGVPGKDIRELSPHAQASLRLTDQGRLLLEEGKAGDAIGMLERAINVDSTNGLNYYYLSEAWLYKGNFRAAEEFNGLARIYLKDSPQWMVRVSAQEDRIDELSR